MEVSHADLHWAYEVTDRLGYCGCGYPTAALSRVRDMLRLAPFYDHHDELRDLLPQDDGFRMLLLGVIDRARLIEHGGNIEGSWLTDDGERFLAILDQCETDDDWDAIHGAGFSCSECDS